VFTKGQVVCVWLVEGERANAQGMWNLGAILRVEGSGSETRYTVSRCHRHIRILLLIGNGVRNIRRKSARMNGVEWFFLITLSCCFLLAWRVGRFSILSSRGGY
jgi:hypothetical protein